MKISTRKLLLNRYVIFCFGFVLLFQLFSYWVLSGSLEVIFKMGWDWYLKTGPSFSIYPVSGFNLLQTVFPLVASILALPFLYERVNYSFIYHRTSSYRRYIMKRMMITLLWGCVVVYVAYLFFSLLGQRYCQQIRRYRDNYFQKSQERILRTSTLFYTTC